MQQSKRISALITLLIFLLGVTLAFGQAEKDKAFVGSKASKKYHTTTCRWGKNISPKNRVEFSSAAEAEKAGYIACKICRPSGKKPKGVGAQH
jgi:methylphosphotriester-DNA--protein-cysteine methyltransferase